MGKDLSEQHGFRKIWPFVPVFNQDFGGWISSNAYNKRGNEWIRHVADSLNPTADELRIIREAFAVDPSNLDNLVTFDPNSHTDATVIAPLRKLGLIDNDEIAKIIEDAEISVGVSGKAGITTLENLLANIKDSNGVVKSPGLRVLDELYEGQMLLPPQRGAIYKKKSEFLARATQELSRGLGLSRD